MHHVCECIRGCALPLSRKDLWWFTRICSGHHEKSVSKEHGGGGRGREGRRGLGVTGPAATSAALAFLSSLATRWKGEAPFAL